MNKLYNYSFTIYIYVQVGPSFALKDTEIERTHEGQALTPFYMLFHVNNFQFAAFWFRTLVLHLSVRNSKRLRKQY